MGTFVSQETRDKISKNQPREKSWPEESRNKVREANRRRKGSKRVNKNREAKEISSKELNEHIPND